MYVWNWVDHRMYLFDIPSLRSWRRWRVVFLDLPHSCATVSLSQRKNSKPSKPLFPTLKTNVHIHSMRALLLSRLIQVQFFYFTPLVRFFNMNFLIGPTTNFGSPKLIIVEDIIRLVHWLRKKRFVIFMNQNCCHYFCDDCIGRHLAAKIQENILMVKCPHP